eukprot:Lithocolla_globosa_v1_NODE_625_length_3568_cov_66.349274.p1 type:complete len:594 gc:universal NODE_625_length_3568_cov_66.349274:1884-103(-)
MILAVFVFLVGVVQAGPHNHYKSYLGRKLASGEWDPQERLPVHPFVESLDLRASLSASPDVLQHSGDTVRVSWNDISRASDADWVGVYMGADMPDSEYLDYFYVTEAAEWGSGRGTVEWALVNLRTQMQFRYFQYQGNNAYNLITQSNMVTFANANEPLQGHVALTSNPTEMRVEFASSTNQLVPSVEYGTVSGQLTKQANGSSLTYTVDMMCGSPANIASPVFFIDPGWMHNVLLTHLEPSTRYFYTYGHLETGMSLEKSFVTAPAPGHSHKGSALKTHTDQQPITSTKIIAFGDLGVNTPGPRGTIDRLMELEMDDAALVLHFGDISYGQGRGYIWDAYMDFVEPVSSRAPYMVSIGNHEYCYLSGGDKDPSGDHGEAGFKPDWGNYGNDGGGECGVPMYYRYHMPDNGNALFWYSFDYGNMHIMQMSTEHDFFPDSEQYEWMERDLAGVNRSDTPWVIVTGHRPMYNSEIYPSDFRVAEKIQEAFEDLLIEHDVDIALWGHYHSYERTCAVYQNRCQSHPRDGLVHITVGSAGAWLDNVGYYDVEWRAYAAQEFGYARMSIGDDEMLLEYVQNNDGQVYDSITLTPKRTQ